MTFGHYQLYAEGYQIREARKWERTRMIMSAIYTSVGSNVSPTSLFPLITDHVVKEKSNKPSMTKEQVDAVIRKMDAVKSWTVYNGENA